MASRQEIDSIEHLHNFMSEDDEAFPLWDRRYANDNLVKASCTWKPIEDASNKERNGARFQRTAETGAQQGRKSLSTKMRALFNEKENVKFGSTRPRFGLSLTKAKASAPQHRSSTGLLGFTDVKRFQEVSNKPLSQREVNVLDEAGVGRDATRGSIASEYGGALAAAFLEGSQSLDLKGKHLNCPLEFGCSKPDCSQILIEQPLIVLPQETSLGDDLQSTELLKASIFSAESMKARLLSEFKDRSENEILCDQVRPDDPCFLSQLKNPCEEGRPCSETGKALEMQCVENGDCSKPSLFQYNQNPQANMDHVVVLFSVQKFLEENAARVNRHKLLKLSSFCSLYSRKALQWLTRVCREQNITNFLQCIQQIFSPAARGFTRLDSQKLPEFSTKTSSPSPKKVLAKDNELRAVLLKINEVLAGMETTLTDNRDDMSSSGATVSLHGS